MVSTVGITFMVNFIIFMVGIPFMGDTVVVVAVVMLRKSLFSDTY